MSYTLIVNRTNASMGWEVTHTICLLGYNHSLNLRHNYICYNYVMLESIDVNSKIYMCMYQVTILLLYAQLI